MIEVVPWFPNGDEVDARAKSFCRHFLAAPLDRRQLAMAWIACEGSRVLVVSGIGKLVDVPVFRAISEPAARALAGRVNAYLADQGVDGFLLSLEYEAPEQRSASLAAWGSPEVAERVVLTVR